MHEQAPGDLSGFWQSRRAMFGRTMYIMALQKPAAAHTFAICRPNTGASYFDMEVLFKQTARFTECQVLGNFPINSHCNLE